ERLLALRNDVAKWAPSWCQSLINARRAELGELLDDADRLALLREAALAARPWLSPASRVLKFVGFGLVVASSIVDFYTFWEDHHHNLGGSVVYSVVGLVGSLVVMWAAGTAVGIVAAGAVITLPAIAVGAAVLVAGTILVLGAQCAFKYAYEHGDLWNRDKGRFTRQAASDLSGLEDQTAERAHLPPV